MTATVGLPAPVWLSKTACSLDAFRQLVEETPEQAQYPHASRIESCVPVYDSAEVVAKLDEPAALSEVLGE